MVESEVALLSSMCVDDEERMIIRKSGSALDVTFTDQARGVE